MTGFGRGTVSGPGTDVVVEVYSVNNRYLDVTVRGGREASLVESRIREVVRQDLERGKVTVTLSFQNQSEGEPQADLQKARGYLTALKSLKDELGLPGDIDLALLAGFRDTVGANATEHGFEEMWEHIGPALAEALETLIVMREREGKVLAEDLITRLHNLEQTLKVIDDLAPGRSKAYAERIKNRIHDIIEEIALDEDRIYHEVALYADRIDISEECIRLRSHLEQARSLINGPDPAGRQLNFLLQEMHREVNTLGSKANDQDISHIVVGMKEELEKIREQVQNIE